MVFLRVFIYSFTLTQKIRNIGLPPIIELIYYGIF